MSWGYVWVEPLINLHILTVEIVLFCHSLIGFSGYAEYSPGYNTGCPSVIYLLWMLEILPG